MQGSYNDGTTAASGEIGSNRVAGSVKKEDKWASVSLQRDGSLALAGGSKDFSANFNKDSRGNSSGFGNFNLGNNSSLKLGGASNGSFRIKGVSPEIGGEVTRNGMGVMKALGSYNSGDTRVEGMASNTGAASIFGEKGDSYGYIGRTAEGAIHTDTSADIRKSLKKLEHLASEMGKVKREVERRKR